MRYDCIVIGASAGGLRAISELFTRLNRRDNPPVIIIQHLSPNSESYMAAVIAEKTNSVVKEADGRDKLERGYIYIAPPNYHMLIEKDKTITLSNEEKVNFSRPSIDVTFETAAEVFREKLIGIILTGASSDGAKGLKRIKELGGFAVVQSPDEAEVKTMPEAAIKEAGSDLVLKIVEIAEYINELE